MRDGNTTNVVYTGIEEAWDATDTVEHADKTGYRLPSSEEWEYAARYIGKTKPTEGNLANEYIATGHNGGNANLTEGYYWTPATYASGAVKDYNDETETRAVAWYSGSGAGDWAQPVAGKRANQLGLFGMSGNVEEWCFTMGKNHLNEDSCVARGGWYNAGDIDMQVGRWSSLPLGTMETSKGFRFARTQ